MSRDELRDLVTALGYVVLVVVLVLLVHLVYQPAKGIAS
jgi:hypothetical protein